MKRSILILATLLLLIAASLQPHSVKADLKGDCANYCYAQATDFAIQCYAATGDETACSQAMAMVQCSCLVRLCHIGDTCE